MLMNVMTVTKHAHLHDANRDRKKERDLYFEF